MVEGVSATPNGGRALPLTQGGATPLPVPSLLTLFTTPPAPLDDKATPLRERLQKGSEERKGFRSCHAWAPNDLSPVQGGVDTPTMGPSLVCSAPGRQFSSQHWKDVVESLPSNASNREYGLQNFHQ